jgi:hypothetical protein
MSVCRLLLTLHQISGCSPSERRATVGTHRGPSGGQALGTQLVDEQGATADTAVFWSAKFPPASRRRTHWDAVRRADEELPPTEQCRSDIRTWIPL